MVVGQLFHVVAILGSLYSNKYVGWICVFDQNVWSRDWTGLANHLFDECKKAAMMSCNDVMFVMN